MDPVLLELVCHCNSSPRKNRSAPNATHSGIANLLIRVDVLVLAVDSVSKKASAWAGAKLGCGEAGTRNARGGSTSGCGVLAHC